jgi:hypothetical protein
MDETKSAQIQRRLDHLDALMRRMTCYRLRDDSKLAFLVASGEKAISDEDLVKEMAVIQWISQHTAYQPVLEITMRKLANRIKREYKIGDWKVIWKIVRELTPDIVKYYMVAQHQTIPDLQKKRWGDSVD